MCGAEIVAAWPRRGVVMRELRRRESMRVALEVPWERQAILEKVIGGVRVGCSGF